MKTYTFNKSMELFKRATKVIPCGIYGHQSPAVVIPGYFPYYAETGKGARYWDVDGNEIIDYMCAYGPMVLGYNDERVDEAYKKQMEKGNCFNHPSSIMVELAEYMVDMIPIADWAYFAKNGGDMTNFSIMVAREHTQRKKIMIVRGGYHGVEPWMQAPGHAGLIEEDHQNFIYTTWNDFEEFKRHVEENKGEIAAFISTPYHHPTFQDSQMPSPTWWKDVEALCRKEGIVLIVDDVRAGFRLHMGGSNEYFGFKPDLIAFCKAIANGYPLSALVGTEEMKPAASNCFHTGSYWFSAGAMAAGLATLKVLKEIDGPGIMKKQGEKLAGGLKELASGYNYDMVFSGPPAIPYYRIATDNDLYRHEYWCAEASRRGAFFQPYHNWFLSCAHSDKDIDDTLSIADEAFKETKKHFGD